MNCDVIDQLARLPDPMNCDVIDRLSRLPGQAGPLRSFYKLRGARSWTEVSFASREGLSALARKYPLFIRGQAISLEWMIDMEPLNKEPAYFKWNYLEYLFDLCSNARFACVFVSGTSDAYRATHIVAPTEIDAILLDAYICNTVEERRAYRMAQTAR